MTEQDVMLELQAIDCELKAIQLAQEANQKALTKVKSDILDVDESGEWTPELYETYQKKLDSLLRRSKLLNFQMKQLEERERRLAVTLWGPAGGQLLDYLMRDS